MLSRRNFLGTATALVSATAVSGRLQAANILGSTLGAVATGWLLLPVLGTAGEGSLHDGAAVLGAMPPSLLTRIGAVAVAADGSVTLTLRDGVLVTFGDAEDAGSKADALHAVLAWARDQPIGVVSIDVSSPAVPTARLRGTTTATAIAPPSPASGSPTPSP